MNQAEYLNGYSEVAESSLWLRDEPPPPALEAVDAVLLDIDGVLVDVRDSFRHVISRAVQFYLNHILEIPGDETFITGEETGLFKMAGDFNNDWDITEGAVAFGLMKLVSLENPDSATVSTLRNMPPGLGEFTGEIKNRGGGIKATLKMIRRGFRSPESYHSFASLYRPELAKQLFMEIFAGKKLCRPFFKFEPRYYTETGLIERERIILDTTLVQELAYGGVNFGVLTGRIPEETEHLFRKTGLDNIINPDFVITDDGLLPGKPDPAGLNALAERMGFKAAIYVGDVPDDWNAVRAYNSARGGNEAPMACCMVQTSALESGLMYRFLKESAADYIAGDVNCLLRALTSYI
ncbi:MAG: HAD family hydrolase [Gemmatimonadota bacterium]|nr:HAD family hydrolase [Gemmatimonadota bacterium]